MISKEFIEQVKKANDLVELVSEFVSLKKSSSQYQGLSPFTNEKTPSFFVDPDKQLFHCFSSGKGGTVIDFVMYLKGFSFREALEFLANRKRIPFPQGNGGNYRQYSREQKETNVQKKLVRYAAKFYQENLLSSPLGKVAFQYLIDRGLTKNTIIKFQIGYAPNSYNSLRDMLLKIGAPMEDALKIGLLKTKNNEKADKLFKNSYDFFRDRIMIPIKDKMGDFIGFGGRVLDDQKPKYLNSIESLVFQKKNTLYNLDIARKDIRESGTVVVVEGYLDCMALDQAGIANTVAPLGTAITGDHVAEIAKLNARVVFILDSDAPGQRAMEKAMDLFLQNHGLPVSGVRLPVGQDPDDFIRENGPNAGKELKALIASAPTLLDKWIQDRCLNSASNFQGKIDLADEIIEKLVLLKEPHWATARVPVISELLQLENGFVAHRLQDIKRKTKKSGCSSLNSKKAQQNSGKQPLRSGKREDSFERQFLYNVIKYPEWLKSVDVMIKSGEILIEKDFSDLGVIQLLRRIIDGLKNHSSNEVFQTIIEDSRDNEKLRNFVTSAIIETQGEAPTGMFADALRRLKQKSSERERKRLVAAIRVAELNNDKISLGSLQLELNQLVKSQLN